MTPIGTIDAKAAAGTLGSAAATLLWVLLLALVPGLFENLAGLESTVAPGEAPTGGAATVALVIGATATLFTGLLAYRTPNAASPVAGDGRGLDPEATQGLVASRLPSEGPEA
jgi:hypothetical protein